MNTNYAEKKPVKFGETSACNGGGNPELSPMDGESVETRRPVCKKCGDEIQSSRAKKFCSARCRLAYNSWKHRVTKGLIRKPGVGSGGNQFGKDNHAYKNGIKSFSRKAKEHYGEICNRCGNIENIVVHHIDHDRTNNDIANLEVLCKACHQSHHTVRDPETGRYIKG